MFVIYEIIRLVVSELLFWLVNRSLRSTVLAAPAAFVYVCARGTWSREALPCVTTNVGMLFGLSQSSFVSIQKSRFRLRVRRALDPKRAAWLFLFECVFFLRLDCFHSCLFLEVRCQTSSQGCQFGGGCLVFASARRKEGAQVVLFSFSDDRCRGVHRERSPRSTWSKSNQFSLEPNVGRVFHPRSRLHPLFSLVLASQFFLFSGQSQRRGICFEFMFWILNEFLRVCTVFLQGGLTGF